MLYHKSVHHSTLIKPSSYSSLGLTKRITTGHVQRIEKVPEFGTINIGWDVFIKALSSSLTLYVDEQVERLLEPDISDDSKKTVFQIQYTWCTYVLAEIVTSCTRHVDFQTRKNPSTNWRSRHKSPLLSSNLFSIDNCQGKYSHCYPRMCDLVCQSYVGASPCPGIVG